MTTLILTESTTKCNKINELITNSKEYKDYKCIPTHGILRTIARLSDIIIDSTLNTVEIKYTNIEAKTQQIEKIAEHIKSSEEILIATDCGEEGESLAWHICDMFQIPQKRIKINHFTEHGISDALNTPHTLDLLKIYSCRAREVIDMLISYTFSPIIWKQASRNIYADRTQIPTLRLIQDNKCVLDSPNIEYQIVGYFTRLTLPFELNVKLKEKNVKPFLESLKGYKFYCKVSQPRKSIVNPPLPLTPYTFLCMVCDELNIPSVDTLQHAQYLYEHGYITCPYTTSNKYSNNFIKSVTKRLERTYGDLFQKYINTKIHQITLCEENQEAIRPTSIDVLARDLNKEIHPKAIQIYDLIWRHTLQSCMATAHNYTVVASIEAPNNTTFIYKTKCSAFKGWLNVENKIMGGEEGYNYLQNLNTDIPIAFECANAKFGITNAVKPYQEGDVIRKLFSTMNVTNIASLSRLITKMKKNGYIKKQTFEGVSLTLNDYILGMDSSTIYEKMTTRECGNSTHCILIEPPGISTLNILEKYNSTYFSYNYLKSIEQELDNICKGSSVWSEICIKCHSQLVQDKLISLTQNRITSTFSYELSDTHTVIDGKYGLCIKTSNETGQTIFLKVKPDLSITDFENAKSKLTLEDVIATNENTSSPPAMELGKHRGKNLYIKKGKYGYYAEWDNNRVALEYVGDSNVGSLTYSDVYKLLVQRENDIGKTVIPGVLRQINKWLSIRIGKTGKGDYLMFKKPKMKTPSFFSLSGFPGKYRTCANEKIIEWVKEKHGVCVDK